jgi:hypothetical protein
MGWYCVMGRLRGESRGTVGWTADWRSAAYRRRDRKWSDVMGFSAIFAELFFALFNSIIGAILSSVLGGLNLSGLGLGV